MRKRYLEKTSSCSRIPSRSLGHETLGKDDEPWVGVQCRRTKLAFSDSTTNLGSYQSARCSGANYFSMRVHFQKTERALRGESRASHSKRP